MRPDVVVFFKVGAEVAGPVGIVPKVDGHVGERGVGNEFAWLAIWDGYAGDTWAAFD